MSTYSFKIRQNFTNFSGGTIDPMVSPATGTQQFTDYLTIYKNKPGQINELNTFYFVKKNLFTDEYAGFTTTKKQLITEPQTYFTIKNEPLLISSGTTIYPENNYKNINIPIEVKFNVVDYGDDIDSFIRNEKEKAINSIEDGERIKYVSQIYPAFKLKFRFFNKTIGNFDNASVSNGYSLAGFLPQEINSKNNFKKSYFRLYFYDSNDTRTQNLLLTEDINLYGTDKPEFNLDRIFWLKKDPVFIENITNNRVVYMSAKFFNAKTGRVHRFINLPLSINLPINVSTLAIQPNWRHAEITIINPNNNNGKHQFSINNGIGASTNNTITMTEYIMLVQ